MSEQENTAAGQSLENTSSETITAQDVGDLNAVLGNTAPAGESTQSTVSSNESSTAAPSGSAEGAGEQGNAVALPASTTIGLNGSAEITGTIDAANADSGSSASGESGNVDAGASAAGAPANTSSDAQSVTPSTNESQQSEQPAQSSSAPAADSLTSLPSAPLVQAGDSQASEFAASSDPRLMDTPAFVPHPTFPEPNGLSLPQIVNARQAALTTPDTDLGDHPAASHIDAIVSATQATAAQGTPAEFVEYVEVKARMIRGAIAGGGVELEQHLFELAKMANSVAHVPGELVSFIRSKAAHLKTLI